MPNIPIYVSDSIYSIYLSLNDEQKKAIRRKMAKVIIKGVGNDGDNRV